MSKVEINGVEFSGCGCGCGAAVSKSFYRPGHDAKHAGQVGREMVRTGDTDLVFQLPSQALRAKATLFYQKRSHQTPAAPTEIKVGRWTYPARMTRAGKMQRNTKRDGSGSWVEVENNDEKE